MQQNLSVFEKMLMTLEKTMNTTMRWQCQRQMMLDQLTNGENYKKLVQDVGDYVINHVSANIDVEDVVKAIKELNYELNKLGE